MNYKMPLGLRIAIIDRAFKKKIDEHATQIGLTAVQLRVLGETSLMEASGISEINQKDLERVEQVTHPTMTGIIKRLENKGFLRCSPSPTDRRYKKIECTEKSRGIHQEIQLQEADIINILCKGLLPEEIDDFIRITDTMLKNISE